MDMNFAFDNPFRPGAGHTPPYLAGRNFEKNEFEELLRQSTILENAVLTGLRGVGKTVLLDELKSIALAEDWLWVGNDLSESASLKEENIAVRLLSDLSALTSMFKVTVPSRKVGFGAKKSAEDRITYQRLLEVYQKTAGLTADKVKAVLEYAWDFLGQVGKKGVVFAYDEAQNLSDHAAKDQFPLSLLLDVFQSIQRKGIPFMLLLTGLPTLYPKLVESRTYAERMFKIIFLDRLSERDSKDAILKPIEDKKCPVTFNERSINLILKYSGGYPYFIQYMCREVFDIYLQSISPDLEATIPMDSILRKLDRDFYAGRWTKVTERQRELLIVMAENDLGSKEFSLQEAVTVSRLLPKPLGNSQVSQMFSALIQSGILYKGRHGWYSFAVPMFDKFILRLKAEEDAL